MEEITSIPNGLREQLARVQSTLSGTESSGGSMPMAALARQVPELLILLQLIEFGIEGVEITTTESDTKDQRVITGYSFETPRYGMRPVTTTRVVKREVRFL